MCLVADTGTGSGAIPHTVAVASRLVSGRRPLPGCCKHARVASTRLPMSAHSTSASTDGSSTRSFRASTAAAASTAATCTASPSISSASNARSLPTTPLSAVTFSGAPATTPSTHPASATSSIPRSPPPGPASRGRTITSASMSRTWRRSSACSPCKPLRMAARATAGISLPAASSCMPRHTSSTIYRCRRFARVSVGELGAGTRGCDTLFFQRWSKGSGHLDVASGSKGTEVPEELRPILGPLVARHPHYHLPQAPSLAP